MMRWPNLFLVGAPRAGTTALYNLIRQHRAIYMTGAKEPGFFAVGGDLFDLESRHERNTDYHLATVDDYQRLFRHVRGETILGDATPAYLHDKRVPHRIAHYAPDARVLAILRNPARRSYSAYMMGVRDGFESRSFAAAVEVGLHLRPEPPLLACSRYADAIELYQTICGPERVKVLLTEELEERPQDTLADLFEWLGVGSQRIEPRPNAANPSGYVRHPGLVRLLNRALDHRRMRTIHLAGPRGLGTWLEGCRDAALNRLIAPRRLSEEIARSLNQELFAADIERTGRLTGRDLSHWLDG